MTRGTRDGRLSIAARLLRYARLWRSLPDEERRMRAGRRIERLFRRDPAVRKLGLIGDQPRWSSFRRALSGDLETAVRRRRATDPLRGPLHVDLGARAARVAERAPTHVISVLARARDLLDRRFDLLGSGPSRPLRPDGGIDWHRDFKSGLAWDPSIHHLDVTIVRGDGSDIKVPWELSRFHHLTVLGQAWLLAPLALPSDDAEKLRRECATEVVSQIDDWIAQNPRGLGVNWACTMDVAIRAFNWLAALAMLREAGELDDGFVRRVLRSLWTHGRHIRQNLEVGRDGLTSNHYLSDIVGLYALGCGLPELREASAWRTLGRAALTEEMDRQVLPDGVDFERSIPYQRLVTELMLHGALLARATGEPLPSSYDRRLGSMLEFVATYTRPDGTAPQWGDNDDGRLLPLDGYASGMPHDHRHLLALGGSMLGRSDLVRAAGDRRIEAEWLLDSVEERPPITVPTRSSRAFPAGGYYVLRDSDLHFGLPCGPVGTAGIGNHTHNDLFAPCVWAGGREWISDPGTGNYTSDPVLRNRMRSTAVHATLQLGAREQNGFGERLDDLFVMSPRSKPEVTAWRHDDDGAVIAALHRGFGDSWVHSREVRFDAPGRTWTILDVLSGGDFRAAEDERVFIRFPLAPGVEPRHRDLEHWPVPPSPTPGPVVGECLELSDEEGRRFWIGFDLPEGSRVEIVSGLHSPRYGVTVPSRVVVAVVPPAGEVRARSVLHAPACEAE